MNNPESSSPQSSGENPKGKLSLSAKLALAGILAMAAGFGNVLKATAGIKNIQCTKMEMCPDPKMGGADPCCAEYAVSGGNNRTSSEFRQATFGEKLAIRSDDLLVVLGILGLGGSIFTKSGERYRRRHRARSK